MYLQTIRLEIAHIYIYMLVGGGEQDLALNTPRGLIYHKTLPNQTDLFDP